MVDCTLYCRDCRQLWDSCKCDPAKANGEPTQPSAATLLRAGAKTYEERNALYGDNYKFFGSLMLGMFPRGLTVRTEEEWNRLALMIHIATKMTRYAQNFATGGHADSAHDAMVYAAMLEELTVR